MSEAKPDSSMSAEELKQIEENINKPRQKRGHGWGVGTAVKKGHDWSDSTMESGVDQRVESDFPGAKVKYGPVATGRIIPADEGGGQLPGPHGGRPTRDVDFEGVGGPADKAQIEMMKRPGDDDVPEKLPKY